MFQVIESISAPEGFVNLVRNRYRETEALLLHEGNVHPLFAARSGVLQGCPLSAVLLVICIDPLLWALSEKSRLAQAG